MATYGYEFESDDDPRKDMVERVERMVNEGGVIGGTLVDFIPVCELHIPNREGYIPYILLLTVLSATHPNMAPLCWLQATRAQNT